jgi:Zn-dependent metalloprotease
VYEFFSKFFGHTASLPLTGFVHFTDFDRSTPDFLNAIYFSNAIYFGDGDEDTLNYFANGLDIIAHEVVHGITESFMVKNATTPPPHIIYEDQTGALNESLSDVFASMIEQYRRKQTAEQADWLLGEGIISVNNVGMAAIRSMKAPGEAYRDNPVFGNDIQPRHMENYLFTSWDNGGVHINSGIPNYAFYLVATRIGGYSWEAAGKIWWAAYTKVPAGCDFARFARLTIDAATGRERDIVIKAWDDVGVVPSVQILNPPSLNRGKSREATQFSRARCNLRETHAAS